MRMHTLFGACLLSCTRSADDARVTERADAAPAPTASASSAVSFDSGPSNPIIGEWERRTEPYRGMRIAFRDATHAVVAAAPPVTQERLTVQTHSNPPAIAKAQLECQRSLWKTGEELVTNARPLEANIFEATILVRDWGFTGTCRHADSRAPARLIASTDELTIEVTRGTTVKQQWTRVGP